MTGLAVTLMGIILAVLVARAVWVLRREGDARPRGIPPGKGYTEVVSEYQSGVGGGNDLTTRIPRDPQEYARSFVPRRHRDKRS